MTGCAPKPADDVANGSRLRVVEDAAEEARVVANPDRLADGWQRRSFIEASRAGEARALYESLGFEVFVEVPAAEQFSNDCGSCRSDACRTHVLLYTRKR